MSLSGGCGTSAQRPAALLAIGAKLAPGGHPSAKPSPFTLADLQRRRVEYLRVSVTDRCNYRCTYCMPEQGVDALPRKELLSFDEIVRLVGEFVALGVRKVRITGGEPLVRRGIVELVGRLAEIPGIDDLSLTTNGHLLPALAGPLAAAGLQRINVSLDTLDPEVFSKLTRVGSVDTVLRGLDAADRAGLRHTKINAVMLRGLSEASLLPLAEFCADRDYVLRCIEYMPIGTDDNWGPETWWPIAEVRERLQTGWELTPDTDADLPGGGPAVRWLGRSLLRPGRTLHLGLIAAVSEKFCNSCNRVRLSPTGVLRECLSTRGSLSLRDMMRRGASSEDLRRSIGDALAGKVDAHRFDRAEQTLESMSAIGG